MSIVGQTASSAGDGQMRKASSITGLRDRLDSLWMVHLRHLDAYTKAQKALQEEMRSGFFSLSRANFSARSGIRYGKDYFHDRAIATTRAKVEDAGDARLHLRVVKGLPNATNEGQKREQEDVTQQPSPPPTPGPEADEKDPTKSPSDDGASSHSEFHEDGSAATKSAKLPLEADPLRWYGVLVPQELRSAQTMFSTAIDDNALTAVNAGRAMREVEVEISRLRKEIRKAERAAKS